jgi:hypothetical protein
MVVAGLALAAGLEELVISDENQFQLPAILENWILWVFFIIFVSTVVRFVHGAMRHFDHYYVEQPQQIHWKGQPLWDFLFLGFEAFIFFILAFSLQNQPKFISYYLVLLLIDTLWLFGVFSPRIKQVFHGTPLHWIVANAFVLVPIGIPWIWCRNSATCPLWLIGLFFASVIAHTIMDYATNWEFYFGRPFYDDSQKEISHQPVSNPPKIKQDEVETVFIAGAYMGSDFNEIETNIRLAESYSIELWNRGYKVFCPHLNTCHFEVKAKAHEEAYREFDMIMLESCDAILALPNWETSVGAKEEIDKAKKLGKPVFYSLDELPTRS